ncbi:nuclear factor NF-kappa-B p110 subunit isoform X2 [Anabrus simplex]
MMNTVPSPSSYSNSSADSQESSNISMASPMTIQLSPHQVIYLPDSAMEEMLPRPYLKVREEPVEKFRFRYKSEMMGTHGSILGRNSDKNRKKSYPSVELCNYSGPAVIRCSLYTAHPDESQRSPHTHRLVVRVDNDDKDDPHDIIVSREVGYFAVFQGMGIIHTAKKHITDELVKKKRARFLEMQKAKNINVCSLSTKEEAQIRQEAEQEAKKMNLNSVTLCFEAFRIDENGYYHSICKPVFSRTINNMKSALTGELKICRIDKHVSSCMGGEEVFILVEKVGKKNIKIKFFEVDDEDNEIWCDYGKFSELDVHHQYAIVFKTPPYRDLEIEDTREVFLQLYRPTDGDCSEPIKFSYRPSDKIGRSRKRQRSSLEHNIPVVIDTNPKNFVNNTLNQMETSSNNVDRLINPLLDPVLSGDKAELLQQILDESDDNMDSSDFRDFVNNLSLSELNWLPKRQWDRIPESENGKPAFSVGTEIGKPAFNMGTENGKPAFTAFNMGTENGKPAFTMSTEYCKPAFNHLDPAFGLPFRTSAEFDISGFVKTEHRFTGGYCDTLNLAEAMQDLVTDGPKTKELVTDGQAEKSIKTPPVQPSSVTPATKVSSGTCTNPAITRLADSSFDDSTLKFIKKETKASQMHPSDLLAKKTVEELTDLLKLKPPSEELRVKVSNIFGEWKSEAGDGPLHTAILNDQKDLLKQMLIILGRVNNSHIVSFRNFHAQTPLHVAVLCNQADSAKALLSVGADPNAVNSKGDTPLHIAVDSSYDDCITELLNKENYVISNYKPRLDLRNYRGWTPLHLAAKSNNLNAVKKLVAAKADVNEVDSTYGRTVLHLAVEEGYRDIVEYLVKQTSVDVNLSNYAGNTALHIACVVNSPAIVKLLMDSKADPHKENYNLKRISEELEKGPGEEIVVKEEPQSEEEDDDDDDEGRLRIDDYEEDEDEDNERDKERKGHTSFDLASNNKEILDLLKKVEEETERRSNTPELHVEVKEEMCDSPISECTISEENGLFDEETFKKVCECLDASKGWVNLADLLDYSFLVPNIRNATSPSKLLLNYADLHGSVTVQDIRNFLEALDEHRAVEIIDLMLTRQLVTTTR